MTLIDVTSDALINSFDIVFSSNYAPLFTQAFSESVTYDELKRKYAYVAHVASLGRYVIPDIHDATWDEVRTTEEIALEELAIICETKLGFGVGKLHASNLRWHKNSQIDTALKAVRSAIDALALATSYDDEMGVLDTLRAGVPFEYVFPR